MTDDITRIVYEYVWDPAEHDFTELIIDFENSRPIPLTDEQSRLYSLPYLKETHYVGNRKSFTFYPLDFPYDDPMVIMKLFKDSILVMLTLFDRYTRAHEDLLTDD